jgi:hypothetical protein
MQVLEKLTEKMGGSMATTSAMMDDHVEYCVTSIPILSSRSVNLEGLVERMINGATVDLPQFPEDEEEVTPRGKFKQQMKYRGVVITSQKAAEAWEQASMMAAQRLVQEASDRGESHSEYEWCSRLLCFSPLMSLFSMLSDTSLHAVASHAFLRSGSSDVGRPERCRIEATGSFSATAGARWSRDRDRRGPLQLRDQAFCKWRAGIKTCWLDFLNWEPSQPAKETQWRV